MKKIICLLVCFLLIFSFSSVCVSATESEGEPPSSTPSSSEQEGGQTPEQSTSSDSSSETESNTSSNVSSEVSSETNTSSETTTSQETVSSQPQISSESLPSSQPEVISSAPTATNKTFFKSSVITVEGISEYLPEDVKINILALKSSEKYNTVKKSLEGIAKDFTAYEMSAVSGGKAVNPTGKINLTFSIPNGYNYNNITLVLINESGQWKTVSHKIDGQTNTITASVSGFGIFAIVDKIEEKPVSSEETTDEEPTTSETEKTNIKDKFKLNININLSLVIVLVFAVIFFVSGIIFVRYLLVGKNKK